MGLFPYCAACHVVKVMELFYHFIILRPTRHKGHFGDVLPSQSLSAVLKKKLECGPMPNVMAALVEYRWRPLFNAAKFGRRAECRAVTLPRH